MAVGLAHRDDDRVRGPGQLGWFQCQVRAPSSPGSYVLRVRGVIDGTTWLEDTGIYWTITVR